MRAKHTKDDILKTQTYLNSELSELRRKHFLAEDFPAAFASSGT